MATTAKAELALCRKRKHEAKERYEREEAEEARLTRLCVIETQRTRHEALVRTRASDVLWERYTKEYQRHCFVFHGVDRLPTERQVLVQDYFHFTDRELRELVDACLKFNFDVHDAYTFQRSFYDMDSYQRWVRYPKPAHRDVVVRDAPRRGPATDDCVTVHLTLCRPITKAYAQAYAQSKRDNQPRAPPDQRA